MIPVSHAMAAHEAMPGSRLVVFDGVGHFPHCEDPERFVQVLEDFIGSTEPACVSQSDWRALLRARGAAASVAMTDMPSPAALEILADSKRAVGRA